MTEVTNIVLTRVGQTFPVGTVVGLYAGVISNSGVLRPAGPPVATATVASDESLTYPSVSADYPSYWGMALIGGTWRAIQATTRIGEEGDLASVISVNDYTGRVVLGADDILGVASVGDVEAEADARVAGLATKQPTLTPGVVLEENLATAVKSKLNAISARPAAPVSCSGFISSAAAAGTRVMPATPAELTTANGSISAPKAMVFLEAGLTYKMQALITCSVPPNVAFSFGVRKIVGYASGAYTVTTTKTAIATTNKFSSGEAAERREGEFEVTESGWYLPVVVSTESTAASSGTGIAISITP